MAGIESSGLAVLVEIKSGVGDATGTGSVEIGVGTISMDMGVSPGSLVTVGVITSIEI